MEQIECAIRINYCTLPKLILKGQLTFKINRCDYSETAHQQLAVTPCNGINLFDILLAGYQYIFITVKGMTKVIFKT